MGYVLLHELHIMERYVTTTYGLQELQVCIQGGYISSTYPKYKINALIVEIIFFNLEFLVCCRRAWYVLQLREQLSTNLADVLRQSPTLNWVPASAAEVGRVSVA